MQYLKKDRIPEAWLRKVRRERRRCCSMRKERTSDFGMAFRSPFQSAFIRNQPKKLVKA